jgi:U3 small nucleolar RNA-associated protein 19
MTLLQRHVEGEYEDPFDPEETDPLKTNALESSLWELETVQSHYHPNISKLAKIISEPFRKPQYNMEDFLDHSYESLIDQEMGKNIRNVPAVEFDKFKVFGDGQYMEGWSF